MACVESQSSWEMGVLTCGQETIKEILFQELPFGHMLVTSQRLSQSLCRHQKQQQLAFTQVAQYHSPHPVILTALATHQHQRRSTSPWKPSKKNPGATGSDAGDTVGAEQSSVSVLDQLPGGKEVSKQCCVTAVSKPSSLGCTLSQLSQAVLCIADLLRLPGKCLYILHLVYYLHIQ